MSWRLVLGGLIIATLGGGIRARALAQTTPIFNVGFADVLYYTTNPQNLNETVRVYTPLYNGSPTDVRVVVGCTSENATGSTMEAPIAHGATTVVWCDIAMRSTTQHVYSSITAVTALGVSSISSSARALFDTSPVLTLSLTPSSTPTTTFETLLPSPTPTSTNTTTIQNQTIPFPISLPMLTVLPSSTLFFDTTSLVSPITSSTSSPAAINGTRSGVLSAISLSSNTPQSNATTAQQPTPIALPTSSPHVTSTLFSSTTTFSTNTPTTTSGTPQQFSSSTAPAIPHEPEPVPAIGGIIGTAAAGNSGIVFQTILTLPNQPDTSPTPTVSSTANALAQALVNAAVSALPTPKSVAQTIINSSTISALTNQLHVPNVPTTTRDRFEPSPTSTGGRIINRTKTIIQTVNTIPLTPLKNIEQRYVLAASQEKNPQPAPLLAHVADFLNANQSIITIPSSSLPSTAKLKAYGIQACVRTLSTWWIMLPLYLLLLYYVYKLWRRVTQSEELTAPDNQHAAAHPKPAPTAHDHEPHHH